MAIQLSQDMIGNSPQTDFIVASDYLTAIKTIMNTTERSKLLQSLRQRFGQSIRKGNRIALCWIQSHLGIIANERVYLIEKEATSSRNMYKFHAKTGIRNPPIQKRGGALWKESWENEEKGIKEMKPNPGRWIPFRKKTRREGVQVNRLRLGHKSLTQEYLLAREVEGREHCVSGVERPRPC